MSINFILNLRNSFYDFLHDISREFSANSAGCLSNSAVMPGSQCAITDTYEFVAGHCDNYKEICLD